MEYFKVDRPSAIGGRFDVYLDLGLRRISAVPRRTRVVCVRRNPGGRHRLKARLVESRFTEERRPVGGDARRFFARRFFLLRRNGCEAAQLPLRIKQDVDHSRDRLRRVGG
jgi:hypothetical protein